ncbi:lysoplasmalogenase [Neobacillus sp. NRS-1170]|uniref:lysoplasmalogenase n=1 Tax=Neobacillus sp. NRS-1170 TaxID=3233898 RepID=UPI003D278AE1
MWLILFYAYKQIPDKKSRPHWIIWSGLFICMLGDGLIRWFVIGLTAFLVGHLFYTAGFSRYWRFTKLSLFMILPIGLYGFVMGYHVIAALLRNHNDTLVVPVLMYIVIISLMSWSGFLSHNIWAIIGSILFVLSDSILSWNMFVSEIPHSDILIMTTYYTAQFLIAHACVSFLVLSAILRIKNRRGLLTRLLYFIMELIYYSFNASIWMEMVILSPIRKPNGFIVEVKDKP